MRKVKYIAIALVAFILIACGQSTKKEFISLMKEFNETSQDSFAFTISLENVELSNNSDGDLATKAMVSLLEDSSLSVEMHANQEEKVAAISIGLDSEAAENTTIDLRVFDDQVYVSGELFTLIASLQNPEAAESFKGLEGKFLSLTELGSLTNQDTSMLNAENLFSESTSSEDAHTIYEYLDNDDFTKEGDVLTATITYDDYKKIVEEHDISEDISFSEFEKYADDMTIVTKLNKETGEHTVDVALDFNNSAPLPIEKATIKLTLKAVEYTAPEKPSDEDVLTAEEFQQLVQQNTKMSDAQFEELYKQIEENAAQISEEDKKLYLETYQQYFTEEQYNRLKELLLPGQ